ncbi:MAG: hemolysin family protein [Burkholderiaceae bacterium]
MEIVLLLILIVLNGVFAMSELALVAARKTRLTSAEASGDTRAKAAIKLKQDPTRFLSTVQIGITSISILNGIVGEAALAGPFSEWLITLGLDPDTAAISATVLIVIVITYVSIVIGELLPKRIAQVAPASIALTIARPMSWLARAAAPFVWLLSVSTEALLSLLRIRAQSGPPITEEEIHAMLAEGSGAGVLKPGEFEMVRHVFGLDDRRITTYMTPRSDLRLLDAAVSVQENLLRVIDTPHAVFPVVQDSSENVIGCVSIKTLAAAVLANRDADLGSVLEKALFVPETISGRELIESFRSARTNTALVVDEYGDLQGLATLNDLMQAIAGEIDADFNRQRAVQHEDGSWLLDGRVSTDQLKQMLRLNELPDEARNEYQTLGGMMMALLGRVAIAGDTTEFSGWRLQVLHMTGRRIGRIRAEPLADPADADADAESPEPPQQ